MPDISMCDSTRCQVRTICARHGASGTEPSEYRQAYMEFGDAPCAYEMPTSPGHGYYGDRHVPPAPRLTPAKLAKLRVKLLTDAADDAAK